MDTRNTQPVEYRKPEGERGQPQRRGGSLTGLLLLAALVVAGGVFLVERFTYDGPREAVFPLPQQFAESYTDDWGATREQGFHEGTDIYAPEGTPLYALTGGTVVGSYGSQDGGWNTLGGYTVMIRADYDIGPIERGDRLYYAHLQSPSPLQPGESVQAGQQVGEVGSTAGEEVGTVADFPPHMHLGWYVGWNVTGDRDRAEAESGAANPYPVLEWVRENGGRVVEEQQ